VVSYGGYTYELCCLLFCLVDSEVPVDTQVCGGPMVDCVNQANLGNSSITLAIE